MNILPTVSDLPHTMIEYINLLNDIPNVKNECDNVKGLKYKFDLITHNDADFYDGQTERAGPGYNNREFSDENQRILKNTLDELLNKKDKLVIVEIGVHRNAFNDTSTGIILINKRDTDIYLGIDIEDKSFLNNPDKNIYTLQSPSENKEVVLAKFAEIGIDNIDLFIIDGFHSVNQVYKEWEYTELLSSNGAVVIHDTNGHPGPYFLLESIDTSIYDVYKYCSDIKDWGIGVIWKRA